MIDGRDKQVGWGSLTPTLSTLGFMICALFIVSPFDDMLWAFLKTSDNATATQALSAILQVVFTALLLLITAISTISSARIARESMAKTEELAKKGWELEQQVHADQVRNQLIASLPILHFSKPTVERNNPNFLDTSITFTVSNVGNGLALFTQITLKENDPTLIEYAGSEDLFALAPGDTINRAIVVRFLADDRNDLMGLRFRVDGEIGTVRALYQDIRNNHLSTSAELRGSHDLTDLRFSAFEYAPEVLTRA